MERHHLYPKAHLESLGIKGTRRTNQIGNMAFIDWPENTTISDDAPSSYWPVMSATMDAERVKRHCYWHALPVGWEQLDYDTFLEKRRKLIAQVIHDGFEKLSAGTPSVKPATINDLIKAGESTVVEFKSSARWNLKAQNKDAKMEQVILKTVAGFMNAEGGSLLIGVADDGSVVGLENDFKTLSKPGRDGYELFLRDLFETKLSGAAHALVRVSFEAISGQEVCRLDVSPSARPTFVQPLEGKDATEFWVRTGNSTRQLSGVEMVQYQEDHWD